MCSKPPSLPFVDDSPPRPLEIESPSEARVAERLATAKSPMKNDTKVDEIHFTEIRGLDIFDSIINKCLL